MTATKTSALAMVVVLAAASAAGAQQAQTPAAPAPARAPAAAPAPVEIVPPATPAAIPIGTRVGEPPSGYDSAGRRDPFISLVMTKRMSNAALDTLGLRTRTGLAAVAVADVTVRGITKAGTKMLAILEAPNKQSYVAKTQDKLLDAAIKSIDANGVVFVEQTGDEVRKSLRPIGEVIR